MSKARVDVLASGEAQVKEGAFRANGALNPLDVALLPDNCSIIAMAPASLITNVYSSGSYYELSYGNDAGGRNKGTVHLPVHMRYQPGGAQRVLA